MPNINLSILNQKSTPAFFADTLANRPAPSFVGRIFISTDTYDLYRDTGSAWDLLSPSAAAGVTGSGSSNSIAFWNGTSSITYDVKLTYDSTTDTLYVGDPIVSSGKLIVNNSGADDHIVIIGANAPSFRINNGGVGATQRIGFGLSTSANNFIQGSVSGDMCVFNSSTTPSPILFGIWNGVNTQEAARISNARNFLIGQVVDTGEKLQVTGNVKVVGDITANNLSSAVNPTWTFGTTSGIEPNWVWQGFNGFITNIGGFTYSGYTKAGNITINNSTIITSITSDVEILNTDFSVFSNLLTLVSFPNLIATSTSFTSSGWNVLTTLNIPLLQRVGNNFNITSCPLITSLTFNSLLSVGGLNFNTNNQAVITTISLSNLTHCYSNFQISTQSALNNLNLSSLSFIGGSLTHNNLGSLPSLSLNSLSIIGSTAVGTAITITNCGSLTSISLNNIVRIIATSNAISMTSGTASLTTFTLGSGLKQVGTATQGNWVMTSCALNQASVDNILIRLAALDGTNGTTAFSNKLITITGTSSTPSAAGLTAKATLQARGNIVNTN